MYMRVLHIHVYTAHKSVSSLYQKKNQDVDINQHVYVNKHQHVDIFTYTYVFIHVRIYGYMYTYIHENVYLRSCLLRTQTC